jgi:DNA replication and repair protein RecF
MYLKSLRLKNFRIYDERVFEFCPTVNAICGPNARGKTTVLEAIYLLIAGRSFRTAHIKDMIRHGADAFFVEARFVKHGIEQVIKFSSDGKSRRVVYNNTPCKSATNLYGLIHGVAMTPDDVELVKGAPGVRRQFLDIQLAQVDPLYVHYSSRYMRAMKQRNALLKKRRADSIEMWENEMSKAAAYIVQQRRGVASIIEKVANQVHGKLSRSTETLSLQYKTSAPLEELQSYYSQMWQRHRPRELEAGVTFSGPHRDDLLVMVGENEARYYASEGQQRSCIASLRLAGWEQLKRRAEVAPLMLVDDLGVSLDASRRHELFSHLSDLKQVFLTTTESVEIPNDGIEIAI